MYVFLLIIYAFLQELTYDELLWKLKDKLFDFPAKGILLPPKPEPVKEEVEPELENPYEKVEEEHLDSQNNKKPMWDDGSNDEEEVHNSMDDEDDFSDDDEEIDVNVNVE